MNGWLVGLLILLLAMVGYGWSTASEDAKRAGERADSLHSLNQALKARQQSDSVALERERLVYIQKLNQLDSARQGARQEAARASRTAQNAQTVLRHTLAGQDSALALLDALVEAEEQEDVAQAAELAAADSTTLVVSSLLAATEQALASERILRRGTESENQALRDQVDAMNRDQFRTRLASAGAILTILTIAVVLN